MMQGPPGTGRPRRLRRRLRDRMIRRRLRGGLRRRRGHCGGLRLAPAGLPPRPPGTESSQEERRHGVLARGPQVPQAPPPGALALAASAGTAGRGATTAPLTASTPPAAQPGEDTAAPRTQPRATAALPAAQPGQLATPASPAT